MTYLQSARRSSYTKENEFIFELMVVKPTETTHLHSIHVVITLGNVRFEESSLTPNARP